jgi:hypothetical protein
VKLLLLACLALPCLAQGPRTFQLKDGSKLNAEIVAVKDGAAELRVHIGGGTTVTTRRLDEFDPRSAYQLMLSATAPDDIEGQVKLVEYAVDHGLFAAARDAMRRARAAAKDRRLPPDVEARLVDRSVDALDRLLTQMIGQGKVQDAEVILQRILQTETPRVTDERKRAFVDKHEQAVEAARGRVKAERAQRAQDAAEQARKKQVDAFERELAKANDQRKKGLLAGKEQSAAKEHFSRAVRISADVAGDIDRLGNKKDADPTLVSDLKQVKQEAEDMQVSCLLHTASVDLVRGSFNSAMGHVNRALAIHPENQQALAMRARIEVAANSDDWAIGPRY